MARIEDVCYELRSLATDYPYTGGSPVPLMLMEGRTEDQSLYSLTIRMEVLRRAALFIEDITFEYSSLYKEWEDSFSKFLSRKETQARSIEEGLSQAAYFECLFRKSRGLLYGDKYKESLPSQEDTQGTEWRVREEFFANLGSLEELKDFILKTKRVLHFIVGDTSTQSTKTSLEFLNLFVSEEYRLSILNAMDSQDWDKVESLVMPVVAAFPGRAILYHAFIILAVFHLSMVYQYLIGHVDRGGGKTYSSSSLEFRNIYISIVLFLGAYVWIKSRDDVVPPSQHKPSKGIRRKSRETESGAKEYFGPFEPRFKPSHAENYISVGSFEDEEEARAMYQILAFFFGKNEGELPLRNGGTYVIPRMTEHDEEQCRDPKEKRKWVKDKAKAVLEEYIGELINSMLRYDSDHSQPTGDIPPLDCPDANAGFGGMDSSGVQAAEAHPTVQLDNQFIDMDSSGVQSAEAHPTFQLDNQGNDEVPVSLSNLSPNVGPVQTAGMQDQVANDPWSGHTVGRDASQHVTQPGLSGEQYLEPQLQQGSLLETQANNLAINVILDDFSLTRLLKELQRQQQLQQLQSQQQESQISQLKRQQQLQSQQQESRMLELAGEVKSLRSTVQEQESQISQLKSQQQRQQLQSQQQESQISQLKRQQQLQSQQQESRLLELAGEVKSLRSTVQEQESQISQLKSQQQRQQLQIRHLISQKSELEGEVHSLRSTEYVSKRTCFGLTSRSQNSQH